jgi:Immunity protein 42
MVFGDMQRFAIEAELRPSVDDWIFGRLRFWVGGSAYGDWEDTVTLAASARWGRTFLSGSERRTLAHLECAPATAVSFELDRQFALRVPVGDERAARNSCMLDMVGESSLRDKFSIAAVRCADGRDRLILWALTPDEIHHEVVLDEGELDAVVRTYCEWVEAVSPGFVDPGKAC